MYIYIYIYRGKKKSPWTILEPIEIIQRYNYIIRGYVNYYSTISSFPNDIHFLTYLLQYSCLHTLASKYNTSLRDIIKKYTKYPTIKYTIEKDIKNKRNSTTLKTSISKSVSLLSWYEIRN